MNSSRPKQNWRHFGEAIFKCILFPENACISLKISPTFVHKVQINQHWFRLWLCAAQATSHYLNQQWLVYRCIYALIGRMNKFHIWLQNIDLPFDRSERPIILYYIYSTYSQPITTQYMQIGTIEAKYRGKNSQSIPL